MCWPRALRAEPGLRTVRHRGDQHPDRCHPHAWQLLGRLEQRPLVAEHPREPLRQRHGCSTSVMATSRARPTRPNGGWMPKSSTASPAMERGDRWPEPDRQLPGSIQQRYPLLRQPAVRRCCRRSAATARTTTAASAIRSDRIGWVRTVGPRCLGWMQADLPCRPTVGTHQADPQPALDPRTRPGWQAGRHG